jgi:hypothetical protein
VRIRVLGAGYYGCHLSTALLAEGHDVEVHEIADRIFAGASGGIPARLHQGQHYPRSRLTRAACQEHRERFMAVYGHLTHGVPVNLYAIAANDSLVDFGTYCQVLRGEIEFVTVDQPAEYGLQNVEGAILTGERHVVTAKARAHFGIALQDRVRFLTPPGKVDDARWDWTIDATFCANDSAGIDRYEPCLTVLMSGPVGKAVTVMDGPFGSLYPWDEEAGLSSLTSAKFTPFSKSCKTWAEARALLDSLTMAEVRTRTDEMVEQMRYFWPDIDAYRVADHRLTIRAMPRSGADARLVDVVRVGERALRIRAGKIDAILHAEQLVREAMA